MTTVTELLSYMSMIIVSVIGCWRFLGGSLRSSSQGYWRSIRSRFRDENPRTRRGAVLAGWLDADIKAQTDGPLSNTRMLERDAGACGPIAAHRLRADGGFDSSRPEGDVKKKILLKSVQRVNADQEPTEQANTQEISAEVSRLRRQGELVVPTFPTREERFGDGKLCIFNARNRDGEVYDMRNGETLLVKTSGHGDSPAADYAWKQVRSTLLRFLGAMSFIQKIFLALGVLCNLLQRANAQQVTGSSNAIDPAPWLRSDTAKVAFVSALFAGGLGAAFIWKRFFCRPPTFTVASINAGLEATPPRVRREDLDSIYPLC